MLWIYLFCGIGFVVMIMYLVWEKHDTFEHKTEVAGGIAVFFASIGILLSIFVK